MHFDLCLVAGLLVMWRIIARLCFSYFPCPEELLPKTANGKPNKVYYDYYGNYVSICHAIFSLILCCVTLLYDGLTVGAENTFSVKLAAYNSLAYFLYDTIISEYYGYNTVPMILHHIGALGATFTVLFTGTSGSEFCAMLLLAELSNPFNLYREIMKHWKRESTKAYFKTSLIFVSLFIISRFGLYPFVMALVYPARTHILLKITTAFVWFVSWHWLFIIFNFALKEIKKAVDKKDAKSDKNSIWDAPYYMLSSLRKNKGFLVSYYLAAGWFSFGTLYLSHPRTLVA